MKTIIVGIDFSNATPIVLEMAVEQAKSFGAELHLFHAVEQEPSYSVYGFTPEEFPAMHIYQEEAVKRAKNQLQKILDEVKPQLSNCVCHVMEGSPLHCLVAYAKESAAGLVVLGTHGHGVIASLLLGSVVEGMVRKAVVPILVVPVLEKSPE